MRHDLLIASSSWESRSTALARRLPGRDEFRQAIICRYLQPNQLQAGVLEENNFTFLKNALSPKCEQFIPLESDLWNPLGALTQIKEQVMKYRGHEGGLNILLDISTFTKAYLLVFLKYLDALPYHNNIKLFYTDLVPPQKQAPSDGVRRIVSLPFYGSASQPKRDKLLIVFLGFEPHRVMGIWDWLEPKCTVPLFSIRRDGKNPTENRMLKDQFLSRSGVEDPIEVPASDPLTVAAKLSSIYASFSDRYELLFGAVGNKLQSVGMYLFMKLQKVNAQIFYPIPRRYVPEYWNPGAIGNSVTINISNGCRIVQWEQED